MSTQRFSAKILQFVVALAAIAFGAGQAMAQHVRACPGGNEAQCVEFLVRYYADRKVEIIDPVKNVPLERCELAKGDCKPLGAQIDMRSVELLQFRGSHCYRACSGGYCYTRCPAH
jgi:hypothetical protein